MGRIETNRISERSTSILGLQGILGILGLGILAEELIKIPRSMTHSLPCLLDSNRSLKVNRIDFAHKAKI